jgi:hypothetical protein
MDVEVTVMLVSIVVVPTCPSGEDVVVMVAKNDDVKVVILVVSTGVPSPVAAAWITGAKLWS